LIGELRVVPQIVEHILAVGDDHWIAAEIKEDLADGRLTWAASGQGREGILQLQVTHALRI
jgi:hypothetical protein